MSTNCFFVGFFLVHSAEVRREIALKQRLVPSAHGPFFSIRVCCDQLCDIQIMASEVLLLDKSLYDPTVFIADKLSVEKSDQKLAHTPIFLSTKKSVHVRWALRV